MRVLLIEPDADTREVMRELLVRWGAEVVSVASSVEADACLVSASPHAIVSELALPDDSTLSFIQRLRSGGIVQSLRAIAVTSARPGQRRAALAAGFDVFLGKPFEPAMLLEVLQQVACDGELQHERT